MPTQCDTKPLEFEGHSRRHLVAKKLFFSFSFSSCPFAVLRVPSWIFFVLRGLRADVSYHW